MVLVHSTATAVSSTLGSSNRVSSAIFFFDSMEKYKAIIYLATCLKENAILNTTRKTTNKKNYDAVFTNGLPILPCQYYVATFARCTV